MYKIKEIWDLPFDILNKKIDCFEQFDQLAPEAEIYLNAMRRERNLRIILSIDAGDGLVQLPVASAGGPPVQVTLSKCITQL